MKTTRCKFICIEKLESLVTKEATIRLEPVCDGNEENKTFFAATPSGQINLHVVNPAAAEVFEEGKAYYIDFTQAN